MLPNFLIVGAQKSGTSSLNYYLQEHPEIYMHPKELHFFDDRDGTYNQGLGYYGSFFNETEKQKVVGECTPCYMYAADAPQRIHSVLPDVKVAFIMRNPVDRAYSAYWKNIKNGREKYSFEDALAYEKKRIEINRWHRLQFSYISRGFYYEQIERYMTLFQKENMLFLLFEDFIAKPQEILNRVYKFIDVDSELENKRVNEVRNFATMSKSKILFQLSKGQYPLPALLDYLLYKTPMHRIIKAVNKKINVKKFNYPPMKPETRKRLLDQYGPSNEKLSKLIGQDLSIWSK